MRGRPRLDDVLVVDGGTTPAYAGKTAAAASLYAFSRDHPRVCGEDTNENSLSHTVTGPPPRMRGRPNLGSNNPRPWGTTPAYAGKTHAPSASSSAPRDHPRVCGEDCPASRLPLARQGPPPRMRGRLATDLKGTTIRGTTPAYAGKTCCRCARAGRRWDHPRVCGEDAWRCSGLVGVPGPPPRMRGRLRDGVLMRSKIRTTPAYAGKTEINRLLSVNDPDHPRVCGEDRSTRSLYSAGVGPPPRMRGRPQSVDAYPNIGGTTPAYAGKTVTVAKNAYAAGDHPRVCGEDAWVSRRATCTLGPPPRMRGRPTIQLLVQLTRGTTPAYAGKTSRIGRDRLGRRDHPRVCGEDPEGYVMHRGRGDHPRVCGEDCAHGSPPGGCGGPPPRMRGRRGCPIRRRRGLGTTPAYAGKTYATGQRNAPAWDHPRVCGEDSPLWWVLHHVRGPPPRMRGRP